MSLNVMHTNSKPNEVLEQDEDHGFVLSLTAEERTKDGSGNTIDDSIGEFLLLDNEDVSKGAIVSRLEMADKMINAAIRAGLVALRDHLGQTDKDTVIISRKQFHNPKCESEFIATCKEIFYSMEGIHLVIADTRSA